MKMGDYFDKPVKFVGDTIECPTFAYATTTCEWEVNGVDYGHAIAHAINNHDHLVEENEKLREALLDLIECKGILTSDKECVINARNLLKEQSNDK